MFLKKNKKTVGKTPLSFFNTLSGKVEVFKPLKASIVTMYTCGPTVYDHVHIGNLRSFVFADTVKRALKANGFKVKHTMNLTDFGHLTDDADAGEDKMMIALKREGRPITLDAMLDVAATYSESFKKDMRDIGNLEPTLYTPASSYIEKEIALVRTLVEKGYTYETSDGIYFDISRFRAYGKLGNINIEALKSGARVEVNPEKKHPADFAVWKKGNLGWESPWGTGFPGWHIECTAMAFATLGKQIDIHTGGIDLIPTHHNGEIAQAEAATSKSPYVHYWMHSGHIRIENTKISKSLGNGIRLTQLQERGYSPLAYRYWLLTGHYRTPINFTFEALDGARQALYRLKRHIYEEYKAKKGGNILSPYESEFYSYINDDLDTPKALSVIWKLIDDKSASPEDKVATIQSFDEILGLGLKDSKESAIRELGVVTEKELPEDVQKLMREREEARAARAWERADELRMAINLAGYLVEDTPDGIRITKAH